MNSLFKPSKPWVVVGAMVLVCLVGAGLPLGGHVARAEQQAQQVASVEQLKAEALKAVRGGEFSRTMELLTQAKTLATAPDPNLDQMTTWLGQFESQWRQFADERHQEYEKTVANVQKLLAAKKGSYALSLAAKAYALAEDKDQFRHEQWVDDLIKLSAARAAQEEASEQWLPALRTYSDLGAVEPASAEWKEKLKLVTRRIRLLALYAPDQLKAQQEADSKDRVEVEALLRPSTGPSATQPATKPLTKAGGEDEDAAAQDFHIDWHDTLKGIHYDMLWESLEYTTSNYYRQADYRTLMLGGLKGLRTLATTDGLASAFPALGEPGKRQQFLGVIRDDMARIESAPADKQKLTSRLILAELKTTNRNTLNLPEEVLTSEFADGALGELDQFSNMIWPSDLEEFNKTTQGEFSGVGIQIQLDDDGSLKVVSPLEDSPAYKDGIHAGDVITHINGKSAKGITLNQAVKKITGPSGTSVSLTIKSADGAMRDHSLRRETIKVASLKGWSHRPGGGWDYFVDPTQKIAYLRLTNFTRTTGDELDRAIEEMNHEGARGVILDLRYNPGGLLTAATEVVDKFIKDGVIVSTRADRETPNAPTVTEARGDGKETALPMVVLVNQYSASASEIVSGALKDQKRALIVGERTYGKGSVQMLFGVASKAAYLKLTTSHYYLPSGRCIHREENSSEWGVDPDVRVEMTPEQMRAAIDARTNMDVLREAAESPQTNGGGSSQDPAHANAAASGAGDNSASPSTAPTTKAVAAKDPLAVDAQLSAALLLLRLQLLGAHRA
jgi:carboxyl-terminal processing protease